MVATIRIFEALAQYTIDHDLGDLTPEWCDMLWHIGSAVQSVPPVQYS